ncbi:hypothetical protein J14TS2_44590 [Bacillus sp. J14TS2]|uniref:DUF4190 domain-containing protein n=1 Tax=Bacillus sp. J14TS2 TaxID=2807188 RepID=UPI001B113C9F|nr:DUF4190 domain-containing protein [Bacillus sp. J14TS2]GIN73984.1 hypothetical protein J14TS2_44590 [Bacillus sp. J14TS2]
MSEKLRTNNKSVVSLTLGILSIVLPAIGLVLGIIGMIFSAIAVKEIERTNENGKGLAIAGFVCNIVGCIIQLFWIVLGILSFYSYSNMEFEMQFISLQGLL